MPVSLHDVRRRIHWDHCWQLVLVVLRGFLQELKVERAVDQFATGRIARRVGSEAVEMFCVIGVRVLVVELL